MAASRTSGLRRLFIGSLAEDVAKKCRKPMLIVRG
jgi:nucleotide-binding universal stress UspA family protein